MKANILNHLIFCARVCALIFSTTQVDARVMPHRSGNRQACPVATPAKNLSRAFDIVKKQQAALQAAQVSTERTTANNAERLIATSSYNLSFADTPAMAVGIVDSAKYIYSGQRGSHFNPYLTFYFTPRGSTFSAGNIFYDYVAGDIPMFTSNVNESDVLADTSIQWNSNNTDTNGNYHFALGEKICDVYDANNNVISCSDQVGPLDSSGTWDNIINIYDSNKNIVSSFDMQWSGSAWDSNTYTFFFYNADGQLIEDSTSTYSSTWTPTSRDYYTYNSSGYLTYAAQWIHSTSWYDNTRCFLNYNTDNTLKSDSLCIKSGSTYRPFETNKFGYTPGVPYWTSLNEYVYYTTTQYFDYLYSKHINSVNMPDTEYETILSSFSSYTNHLLYQGKFSFAYDSYNNPTISYSLDFNVTDTVTGAWVYDTAASRVSYFYYEDFTTAVNNVNPPAATISVFPNPATNNINISITGIATGSRVNIRLETLTGQTVVTESTPWMAETQTLPVSGISPGAYILTVQDAKGGALATQKIIKQ